MIFPNPGRASDHPVYLTCLGGTPVRGNIANAIHSKVHLLKDSQMFVPYLNEKTVPIMDQADGTNLAKAVLISVEGFADLLAARDRDMIAAKGEPAHGAYTLTRIDPGSPTLELSFTLLPLYLNGVYWTSVLATDADTLDVLRVRFPPMRPDTSHDPFASLRRP